VPEIGEVGRGQRAVLALAAAVPGGKADRRGERKRPQANQYRNPEKQGAHAPFAPGPGQHDRQQREEDRKADAHHAKELPIKWGFAERTHEQVVHQPRRRDQRQSRARTHHRHQHPHQPVLTLAFSC
jgi:hypothetical protein